MDDDEPVVDQAGVPPGEEFGGIAAGMTRQEREEEFLRLLGAGVTMHAAAKAVAIAYSTFWRKAQRDPAFAKRLEDARRIQLGSLIQEAERRAMRGSDRLLMFLLSSYAPEKFKSRQAVETTGNLQLQVLSGVPSDDDADGLL